MMLSHNRPEKEGVEDIYKVKWFQALNFMKNRGQANIWFNFSFVDLMYASYPDIKISLQALSSSYFDIIHIFLLLTSIIINIYTITPGTVQSSVNSWKQCFHKIKRYFCKKYIM
jgi:hypothetical protein